MFGLALGYGDLNDHDLLSNDKMLTVAVGKTDPTGMDRKSKNDVTIQLHSIFAHLGLLE